MEDNCVSGNTWPAPAKLNLFLHVTGRRADGYHLLQTVFQFVNWSDELEFKLRSDGEIVRKANYQDIPAESDLVVRAAKALQKGKNSQLGCEITINKKIPTGGGLGGGSSDAATTLVALNHLWNTGYTSEQLATIGLELGADIPIFIYGHAAWAEGIGEQLQSVTPIEYWYLIIHPGCHIPTAEIFADTDLTRHTPAITIRDFLTSGGHNDCESVVRQRFPQVAEALGWLGQYAEARLTGTGSCIFAGFDNRDKAEEVKRQLPAKWQGYIARGINRSPLLERLKQARR